MKAVEKERPDNRPVKPRKLKVASARAALKRVFKPVTEEHQVTKLVETFTDRWEW